MNEPYQNSHTRHQMPIVHTTMQQPPKRFIQHGHSHIPVYGRKGMGWVRNPRKAAYNKIYRNTTFNLWSLFK